MSTVITHDGGTITPLAVSEYSVEQEAGNIVHQVLGRTDPDVTLRPAGLRTGTLTLTFRTAAEGDDARRQHATGTVFTLTSSDVDVVNMRYVLADKLGTVQGKAGEWIITVGFHEVAP